MDTTNATATHQLSALIRAWPTTKSGEDSLPYLIARINGRKESFRSLSEQTLEEEIRALDHGEVQTSSVEPLAEKETIETKSRKDEVYIARNEILAHVVQAQLEGSYALDFVSLLLSRHTPKQAETTISPFLKQHVPLGSIGAEVTQLPHVPDNTREEDRLIPMGWKLQSLNAIADSLLRSATRLEKEIEEEAKRWEQVLAIKERGWSVIRLPREKHTLGVKYGFAEAAPEYRDRGLGALRRAESGNVLLDLGTQSKITQYLRVRVRERGIDIASSFSSNESDAGDDSIETSILQARNAIFDEELYHELYREARHLTNRGVRITSDTILIPFEHEKQVLIDLVTPKETVPEFLGGGTSPDGPRIYWNLCRALALGSKILLSHAHRQNHNRRGQLPPPLTERKPPRSPYSILRPLLALLQQHAALERIGIFFGDLMTVFKNAGLDCSMQSPEGIVDIRSLLSLDKVVETPLVEALANTVSGPLHAEYMLTVPSESSKIRIQTRTHSQGTECKITVTTSAGSTLSLVPQESIFTSADDLEEHILHLLTLDIVSMISVEDRRWKLLSPHEGQLSTDSGLNGAYQVLSLCIEQATLKIKCRGATARGEIIETVCVWTKDTEGKPGLFEAVRDIATTETN